MDGVQAGRLEKTGGQGDVGWREGSTGAPYFLSALRRQFLFLVTIPILMGLLSLAYAVMVEPLYTATAEIRIRLDPEELVSPQISPLDTHVALIQSEPVTTEVISRLGLEPPDEMQPGRLRQTITDIRGWLDLSPVDGLAELDPELALRRGVVSGIDVRRVGDTSLIMIQYTSPSSNLSAEIANAYARTYVEQSSSETDRSLQRRQDRLKQRAEEVRQLALDATKTAQQILAGSDFVVVSADELGRRIADFRSRLSAVNADIATLEARLDQIPDVEDVASSEAAALLTDETAQIYADMQDASKSLERLQAQPGTPESTISQLEDRIGNLRGNLVQALDRYRADLEADLLVISARRDNILAERERVISYGQSEVWPELVNAERRAATYDAIYQSYVQELENLNRQNRNVPVSFVSEARPPTAPSIPNYKVIIAFGVTIGIVLAGALSLRREWRRSAG